MDNYKSSIFKIYLRQLTIKLKESQRLNQLYWSTASGRSVTETVVWMQQYFYWRPSSGLQRYKQMHFNIYLSSNIHSITLLLLTCKTVTRTSITSRSRTYRYLLRPTIPTFTCTTSACFAYKHSHNNTFLLNMRLIVWCIVCNSVTIQAKMPNYILMHTILSRHFIFIWWWISSAFWFPTTMTHFFKFYVYCVMWHKRCRTELVTYSGLDVIRFFDTSSTKRMPFVKFYIMKWQWNC